MNASEQFRQAISGAGLPAPEVIHGDGTLYRFSSNGKRMDQSGWYVLHDDGDVPAGAFGCWRSGLSQTWCGKDTQAMTQAERSAHQQRMQAIAQQREADKAQRQQDAAAAAAKRWDGATPAPADHPYLARKCIKPHGTKAEGEALLSTWLARLKNQNTPGTGATKPTKPTQDTPEGGFVGFVAYPQGHIQKFDRAVAHPEALAANAPAINPDRWAWPHSSAMNGQELDTLMARQDLFRQRGATPQDAERLADKLVARDRGDDERRLCLECRHLRGESTYRCGNARAAGVHTDLAWDMVPTLQRCHGYEDARLPMGVIVDAAPPAPAAAPPEPAPAPSGPTWRELDHAYLAHHVQCATCQCAGRGYGQRCDSGVELWTAYGSMNSDWKE